VAVLLDHIPPNIAFDNTVVAPSQTKDDPEITEGAGVTVTIAVVLHPEAEVYVSAVTPMETPVSTPEEDPIAATDGLPVAQVPPVSESVSVMEEPAQRASGPLNGGGTGFTVTIVAIEQPDAVTVYRTAAMPEFMPDTRPDVGEIVIVVSIVFHVPPGVASERIVVPPTHTCGYPSMDAGAGITDTVNVVAQPVGNV